MPNFPAATLQEVTQRIFAAAGAPAPIAARVAESLVMNNLSGHDSHGVIRVMQYVQHIRQQEIIPDAQPEIVSETETTVAVDGRWGFGQVGAHFLTARLIEKAKQHHLASGILTRASHIGRIGEYAEQAAEAGLFAMLTAGSPIRASVAPFGGAEGALSTDPVAFAFPPGNHPTIMADFATSAVAEGKIRVALNRGEQLPPGYIVDKDGNPSTNPQDFYDGGAILPFGGHKGYSLAFLGELLAGILTGNGTPLLPTHKSANGAWMVVMDVEAFMPLAEFTATTERLYRHIKQVRPAPGFSEVLVPGEPEVRAREKRRREGIFLEQSTWDSIRNEAAALQVIV